MDIRKIPKRMLPNSVSYKEYISDTGEGSSFKNAVTLTNVKIDEQLQFSYSSLSKGKEVVGNAILYYDLVNSKGLTGKPLNESEIIFENTTYIIKDTYIARSNSNTPHHYEIMLK